jgi:hypothetical protein
MLPPWNTGFHPLFAEGGEPGRLAIVSTNCDIKHLVGHHSCDEQGLILIILQNKQQLDLSLSRVAVVNELSFRKQPNVRAFGSFIHRFCKSEVHRTTNSGCANNYEKHGSRAALWDGSDRCNSAIENSD